MPAKKIDKFIPLSVPNLKGNEEQYVVDAIRSEWVSTGGRYITKFENNLATYLGVEGAVACQSGTAGLHLALRLSGVEQDDEVIVPTLTFIAAVNPVNYMGAKPIFMDCDDTLCMDMEKLEQFCENECIFREKKLINKKTNKQIKAIIVVHVFGNLANMEKALEIANKYHLKIIEDATEALGTYYIDQDNKKQFAGTIGDYGVYSFNGNKIITTGGGGMLVAKHNEELQYAKYLSTQAKNDEVAYIHNEIGYNYRMTNLQAALGVAQLEQLEVFIATKARNYEQYIKQINKLKDTKLLSFREDIRPNYWFYSLLIDYPKLKMTKETLMEMLHDKGIQTRPIWGLIHMQKPYEDNQSYAIEKALYYHEHIVNIPCSSNLTCEEIEYIVGSIGDAIDK